MIQLPIQQQSITDIQHGNQLTLCFLQGELCISADVLFRQGASQQVLKLGMLLTGSTLLQLIGQRVIHAHSDTQGALTLGFANGNRLVVPAEANEAWQYQQNTPALCIFGGMFRVAVQGP